jgi:hypothetical protein
MSNVVFDRDFLTDVAAGWRRGYSLVRKFGQSDAVGTSFAPLAQGNIYRTPQVSAATALRVKAGNAADTAAGAGAREITAQGLDNTGAEVIATAATAGASPSANFQDENGADVSFIRLYRAYVSASGTYADASTDSHAADIVIENAAGTEDWATLDKGAFGVAQTQIACYTVPLGKTALLLPSPYSFSDTAKISTLYFFQRQNILDSAAPYSAMRLVLDATLTGGSDTMVMGAPIRFPALTDIGFMAKVNATTALLIAEFDLLIIDDDAP